MQRWLLAGIVIAGCGRISFDARNLDAAGDAPFASGPFGTPALLAELNSIALEDDVSFTADLLQAFFMSDRTGVESPYVAVRSSVDEPFGTPQLIMELVAGGSVNNLRVHPDGLRLVFASNRPPTVGGADLYESTRADRFSPWTVKKIDELSTTTNEYEPCLSDDMLTIYYTGNSMMGDVYRATRSSVGAPFGSSTLMSETVSSTYDGGSWSADRDRVLLFHSARNGALDLFVGVRTDPTQLFTVSELVEINSTDADQDGWLSPDGHTFVFVSDRTGNSEIYIATR